MLMVKIVHLYIVSIYAYLIHMYIHITISFTHKITGILDRINLHCRIEMHVKIIFRIFRL